MITDKPAIDVAREEQSVFALQRENLANALELEWYSHPVSGFASVRTRITPTQSTSSEVPVATPIIQKEVTR